MMRIPLRRRWRAAARSPRSPSQRFQNVRTSTSDRMAGRSVTVRGQFAPRWLSISRASELQPPEVRLPLKNELASWSSGLLPMTFLVLRSSWVGLPDASAFASSSSLLRSHEWCGSQPTGTRHSPATNNLRQENRRIIIHHLARGDGPCPRPADRGGGFSGGSQGG